MTKRHFKPSKDPSTASPSEEKEWESSQEDEHGHTIFSSLVDEDEKTIFSSEEDEPIHTKIPLSSVVVATSAEKKEDCGSSKAQPSAPSVKSETKRRSEETSTDVSPKRAKKVITAEDEEKIGEDSKVPSFLRLWNEEDEIAMLQGIIDFKADTGKSPSEDGNGFYKFIKKSITLNASYRQCMDKIRQLKRKHARKTKNGVEPKSFLSGNDQKCYKLSKFIWGDEGIDCMKSDHVKSNEEKSEKIERNKKKKKLDSLKQDLFSSPNGQKVEDDVNEELIHGGVTGVTQSDWFEKSFLLRSFVFLGVNEDSVKARWSMVPMETKKKLEEKWKLVNAKEFECALQKANFLHEVTSLIAKIN